MKESALIGSASILANRSLQSLASLLGSCSTFALNHIHQEAGTDRWPSVLTFFFGIMDGVQCYRHAQDPLLPISAMKYGARNKISGKVTSIKSDQVMSLVKFEVKGPAQMASVLTTESLQELGLKVGDTVQLVIKAINVLPVKE